ncbi:MAG: methanethiol S-methyltransferase [Planctomycetota bacterium]|jgi:protein-S-isoprenylcysteine O-methyltransferase Ste14
METPVASKTSRVLCFAYGVAVYLLFLATFSYMIGFVGGVVVPRGINDGQVIDTLPAILINALLLGLFGLQHTIMARPAFKAQWTKIIPAAVERSTFVLVTCCILIALVVFWQPLPDTVWQVENVMSRWLLLGFCAFGWLLVLYSTFCIDHFSLFGLRQVVDHLRASQHAEPKFVTPWLYKIVRNPLMLGFLIAFWATPHMTQGHLAFAILTTGYMLFGIQVEERDLLKRLGEDYRRYRERTPMLIPFLRFPRVAQGAQSASGV